MNLMADAASTGDNNGRLVLIALLVMVGAGLYRLVRWFCTGPVSPEPWTTTVSEEMERPDARPICCHCLEPHTSAAYFCPDCGAPVGAYTNMLPFPYLFSIGHLLRTGTQGDFKRTPVTVIGFLLFGLVEYTLFAPVYWFQLLRSTCNHPPNSPAKPTSDNEPLPLG